MSGRLRWLVSTLQQTVRFDLHSSSSPSMLVNGIFEPCNHFLAEQLGRKSLSSSAVQSTRGPCNNSPFSSQYPSSKQSLAVHDSRQQLHTSAANESRRTRSPKAAQHQRQLWLSSSGQDDSLLQSASSMRTPQASSTTQPLASTSAGGQLASVTGTIQRITYRSEATGYTVAKMKVDSSTVKLPGRQSNNKNTVTVTGVFPDMSVGQQWQCDGNWVKHTSYGHQIETQVAKEVQPTDTDGLISYLCGGATKGVGPVTARNMVDMYGDRILAVLDSSDAVQQLTKVAGIGKTTAAKIKSHWELRRGNDITHA